MKDFLHRFFGYRHGDTIGPYNDNLGRGGFMDWRHYAWMVVVIFLCVACYQVFKRKPQLGQKVIKILVIILFIIRFTNQIIRAAMGVEIPAWQAFPFHLCTVMTFVMPLVVLFDWKKLKSAVYSLSIMGGIVTIIMGDYFNNQFLPFADIEGMWAHTALVLVPIIDIAINNFRFEFKKAWTVIVGALILILWGTLANEVFFNAYDTNYMYLKKNGLPGNFGGDYYFLIYIVIFLIMLGLIFGIPTFFRNRKRKIKNHKN